MLSNNFEAPDLCCPILLEHLICFVPSLWNTWSVLSNQFEALDLCCPIILKHLICVVQSFWSTWYVLSNHFEAPDLCCPISLKHLICVVQFFEAPDLCCPIILYTISYLLLVLFLSMQIVLFCSIAFKLIVCLCLMFFYQMIY